MLIYSTSMLKNKKDNTKTQDTKVELSPKKKEKKEFVWDPSDGFTIHDIVGFFRIILRPFWILLKIVFIPIIWIVDENVKMWKFVRAKGYTRAMSKEEREFFESIPVIYLLTGVIGGILVAITAIIGLSDQLKAFFANLDIWNYFLKFMGWIGDVLVWIWDAIVWIFSAIWDGVSFLFTFFGDLLKTNPYLALVIFIAIWIVVTMIMIAIRELEIIQKITRRIKDLLYFVIGTPDVFLESLNAYYRRFNHWITVLLVGEKNLKTRTQEFFKAVVGYTLQLFVITFIAAIMIAFKMNNISSTVTKQIVFFEIAMILAGFITGVIGLWVIMHTLNFFSRKKYITEETLAEAKKAEEEKKKARATKKSKKISDKDKPKEPQENKKT